MSLKKALPFPRYPFKPSPRLGSTLPRGGWRCTRVPNSWTQPDRSSPQLFGSVRGSTDRPDPPDVPNQPLLY